MRWAAWGSSWLLLASCFGGDLEKKGRVDAGDDAGPTGEPAPTELPRMDCPAGWRAVPDPDVEGLQSCDPFPAGGAEDCGAGEAHFPGEPGCARVGPPCPAGDFAEDLPGDARVYYVLADAPDGGDGSEGAPFARIADAISVADDGDVVALGKGTYDESVIVRDAITLWGACVAETILARSTFDAGRGTLDFVALRGATAKNLTVGGARYGIGTTGAGTSPVVLESIVIDGVAWTGLWSDAGSEVVGHEIVVRDVASHPTAGDQGEGLRAQTGATFTLDRLAIERVRTVGVWIEEGSSADLSDAVIQGVLPRETDDIFGHGIEITPGATVHLARAAIRANRSVGIVVREGATLVAEDLVIEGSLPTLADGLLGDGIGAFAGATVDLTRATISRNHTLGIAAQGAETIVRLTDVLVSDTEPDQTDGAAGGGVQLSQSAALEMRRVALVRNHTVGLISHHSTVSGEDWTAAAMQSTAADGIQGFGGQVVDGTCDVVRARFWRDRGAGLAITESAEVSIDDLVVDGIRHNACADEGGCPGYDWGAGIAVADEGHFESERFLLTGNAQCGLQLVGAAAADLHVGTISANPIGANVQTPDFDLARIQDRVRYVGNDTNLDATAIAAPTPVDVLED